VILATQLIVLGSGAKSYYTPWFTSAADNAFLTYELVSSYFGTGGSVSVTAFTKNREDAGPDGSPYSSFTQVGSTDFYHKDCTNLKELVRFKVTLTPGSSPTTAEGVTIRFLTPTWYSTATS